MGKPLISDTAMRSMYATMQQLRAAKRNPEYTRSLSRADRAALQAYPEALPAALLLQLHRRDTLVTEGNNQMAQAGLASYFPDEASAPAQIHCPGSGEECAAVAAGIALKQNSASRTPGSRPVVVALLQSYPLLTGTLSLMSERDLSLLIVVRSDPETRTETNRRIASTKIPILPVDDADAVAVCRVVQESILRARQGWGGTVIHATRLEGAPDALAGMEQRLRARGLDPAL